MNGHHGAQLLGANAYETLFGPVVAHQVHVQKTPCRSSAASHGHNGQLTVSPKPCALSVGPSCTRSGAVKLSQHTGAIKLMADTLLACAPRIARLCRLVGVRQLAYGRLPSKPHARPGGSKGGFRTL